jgi:hypothetical protein
MAYTTINKSSEYFNTVLYTGNATGRTISGVGFQPDWTWIKNRSDTSGHRVLDVVRGGTKELIANGTNAEITEAQSLQSWNSDGFVLGTAAGVNANTDNFVSWNWLANGAGVSNTDGSIASTVSANTTSGFSIVSYTGNATDGATVGHGLGASPACIIFKNRIDSSSAKWAVYHKGAFVSQANPNILYLEATEAEADDTNVLGGSSVTLNSNVFSLGDYNGSNGSGDAMIAYCFAEKKGFSKFGSYTGNGNADGTFVYTGFKPAFIITKCSSATGEWEIYDNKRTTYNVATSTLEAQSSSAELNYYSIDMLSNGFKQRASYNTQNQSGATFIYMAFAEEPLVGTNNIPATAR